MTFKLMSFGHIAMTLPQARVGSLTLLASCFSAIATAATLRLNPPTVLNTSSVVNHNHSTLSTIHLPPQTQECFDPPTSGVFLLPINVHDCFQAAEKLLQVHAGPRSQRLRFGNKLTDDVHLPVNIDHQTCRMQLDLEKPLDDDTFDLWTLYGAALSLCDKCAKGPIFGFGGIKTVRSKGIVELLAVARVDESITASSVAKDNSLTLRDSSVLNASSLEVVPVANDTGMSEYENCFDPPMPRAGLYPTNLEDCWYAAQALLDDQDPYRQRTFKRPGRGMPGTKLPIVIRHDTCVISIDVFNDVEKDHISPWQLYTATFDLARDCTQGLHRLGGRTTVGPKKVINVTVCGRFRPVLIGASEPAPSGTALIEAREAAENSRMSVIAHPQSAPIESSVKNISSLRGSLSLTATPIGLTDSAASSLGLLGSGPQCYDPPLPRERAWPIDFEDCEEATLAIVGDRDRRRDYTFSHQIIPTKYYYPLPTTLRYKTCVIRLDMINDQDQDTVRLGYVEATAWVLAHKCSGGEVPSEEYGGRTTVGLQSRNLINIWVYGRLWPPPLAESNSTRTSHSGE